MSRLRIGWENVPHHIDGHCITSATQLIGRALQLSKAAERQE